NRGGGLPGIRPNGGPAGQEPKRQQEMIVAPGREQEMTADRLVACPLFILPRRCRSGGRPPPGTWVAPLAPIQLHARGRQRGLSVCPRPPPPGPLPASGRGSGGGGLVHTPSAPSRRTAAGCQLNAPLM